MSCTFLVRRWADRVNLWKRVVMEILALASILTFHLQDAPLFPFLACVDPWALPSYANIQLSTYVLKVGGGKKLKTCKRREGWGHVGFLHANCSQQVWQDLICANQNPLMGSTDAEKPIFNKLRSANKDMWKLEWCTASERRPTGSSTFTWQCLYVFVPGVMIVLIFITWWLV